MAYVDMQKSERQINMALTGDSTFNDWLGTKIKDYVQ